MKSNVLSFCATEPRVCPMCGSSAARMHYEVESFIYGVGEDQVTLSASVPVIRCESCGIEVTDGAAEEIRHATICRHLGRLAPDEIRAIREQYNLTQQEWAKRSRLGLASVKRWESGNQIQNDAMDCYLRLLAIPSNFEIISALGAVRAPDEIRFRMQLPEDAFAAASLFQLRKAS
ncbi:helix-turn-helix domain-containing protein [Bradyrhizobium sp. STM 3557]|uniref:helix-turn-helix domain-containing protein n=1 Tax=Bradyrhizobium sp. STM 3557 TaxID=578920 RepID=UPI0038905C5F